MSEFYVNSEAEHSIPAYFKPKQSENMAKAANSSQPAATPRSTHDNKETSWSCGLLPLGRSITPLRKHKGKGVEEKLQEVPFWYFCHSSVSSCFTAHLENALFFLVTICRIQHLTWSQKGARCRWESWAKGCLLCETGTQHCWLAEPKLLPAILHTQGHLFHTGVGIASDLQPVLPLEQWENNFCGWLGTRTWVTVTSHVQRNQGMRSGATSEGHLWDHTWGRAAGPPHVITWMVSQIQTHCQKCCTIPPSVGFADTCHYPRTHFF